MTAIAKFEPTIKIYKPLPDVDVVIFDGTKRATVKLATQLAEQTIINTVPAAFTKVCTESHLASYKASFITRGYKVIFMSSDKIPSLEAWKKAEKADDIHMISDTNLNFGEATGLVEQSTSGLGSVLRRASLVVVNGILKGLYYEDDNSVCTVSHADFISKQVKLLPNKDEGKKEGKES